jgi:dTDP-4-dehydrorhamnose 3,5-epimerase-like enzyme
MKGIEACGLIELPHIHDERGSLSFVESGAHIPFGIERIYYLYGVPDAKVRGAHAHKHLKQLIVPISGSFDIELDDGESKKTFHMNRPDQGLYICPMIWRDLSNFSGGAVCLVLASEKYDEADYIRDYYAFTLSRKHLP